MKWLYWILQWTWGIVQTVLGAILYLFHHDSRHFRYHDAIVTLWNRRGGLSLGMFIFIDRRAPKHILVHEYGHTIQSLFCGPLYLILFGIPSFLWCNLRVAERYRRKNGISYFAFYTERVANRLGEKFIEIF